MSASMATPNDSDQLAAENSGLHDGVMNSLGEGVSIRVARIRDDTGVDEI